jgi:hypothetical protein
MHLFLDEAPYPFSLARFEVTSRFAVANGERRNPRVLVEEVYHLRRLRRRRSFHRRVRTRIEAPRRERNGGWSCAFSVEAPLSRRGRGVGASSLLALFAALAGLSQTLYGSRQYKERRLGADGVFGHNLTVPTVTELLADASFPF